MRKLLVLMAAIGLFVACQKEEPAPENVTFKLSYSLDKGISMTRGGEDLYASFYENFVKTKIVGHPKYNLKFYQDDIEVATFNGEWEATLVTLPEGEYSVIGTSGNYSDYSESHNYMSLSFNEKISIKKGTTNITLNPTYDCYLLFVDNSIFEHIEICGKYRNSFRAASNINYAFINSKSEAQYVDYRTSEGDEGRLDIKSLGFKIGNYYCLDAVATGYQLPPMNNGF